MPACARASGSTPRATTRRSIWRRSIARWRAGLAPADELLAKWQGEWKGSFAPLFRDYAY